MKKIPAGTAKMGAGSLSRLATCHPDLQRLVREVYRRTTEDLSVACGHRGKADQDREYAEGNSKLRWPKSRHNSYPSLAVDLWPYPVDWQDHAAFERLRALVLETARDLEIPIEIIDWDLPHYQLPRNHQ